MKKNNKGFFLAETIVVIALVTTVMAFVYPNVTKLYDNYVNRTKYYDQTEDLYTLKALLEIKNNDIQSKTIGTSSGCDEPTIGANKLDATAVKLNTDTIYNITLKSNEQIGDIKELYLVNYMSSPSSDNYNFNKYLKRIKKTTYDTASYRLIGVFDDNEQVRYASIKIDNPNPNRNCNLGGELNENE